jgi:anti-sigma factor RsiW
MPTCDAVLDLLTEAPREDLPVDQRAVVEAHLAECDDCSDFVAAYDSVADMVRSALEVTVDDALQAELDAAVWAALEESA